jgi:uncharacterized membrane protein YhaH (DUF805 family)
MFFLIFTVLLVGAMLIDWTLLGVRSSKGEYGLCTTFMLTVHAIPNITALVRRLHDSGLSGWFWFINIVPGGVFIVLILACRGPNENADRYGDDPRFASETPRAGRSSYAQVRGVSRANEMIARMNERRLRTHGR